MYLLSLYNNSLNRKHFVHQYNEMFVIFRSKKKNIWLKQHFPFSIPLYFQWCIYTIPWRCRWTFWIIHKVSSFAAHNILVSCSNMLSFLFLFVFLIIVWLHRTWTWLCGFGKSTCSRRIRYHQRYDRFPFAGCSFVCFLHYNVNFLFSSQLGIICIFVVVLFFVLWKFFLGNSLGSKQFNRILTLLTSFDNLSSTVPC